MPKVAHINAYGEIDNAPAEMAAAFGIVSLDSIAAQIKAAGEYDSITLHIHSRGGSVSEGFAIYDFLKSLGKPITTITEGLCASIATVLQLAGTTRLMTPNSEFFIHNPWTIADGDSSKLQQMADELLVAENKLANFYADHTGQEFDLLKNLMAQDTTLTPQKALELGFITAIAEPVKAYAKFNSVNKPTENNLTQIISEMNKTIQAFIDKYKPKTAIKAIQETAADGTVIFIDAEAVATGANVYVGTDNTGDMLPTGDYTLSDGTIINVTDGVITGIVDVETMDALKAEIETLKAQLAEKEIVEVALEAADAVVAEKEAEIEAKQAEIVALKAQIKTNGKVATRNEVVASKSKADKEDRNKFEEAAERKAQYKSSRPTFN